MITKELINQRFTESVNFIISRKIAKNKAEIAENLNIARSKFSEILNGRMSIGLEDLANYILVYNLNFDWFLTGEGEIIKGIEQEISENSSEKYYISKLLLSKDELIGSLKTNIDILSRYNRQLEENLKESKSIKEKSSKAN